MAGWWIFLGNNGIVWGSLWLFLVEIFPFVTCYLSFFWSFFERESAHASRGGGTWERERENPKQPLCSNSHIPDIMT